MRPIGALGFSNHERQHARSHRVRILLTSTLLVLAAPMTVVTVSANPAAASGSSAAATHRVSANAGNGDVQPQDTDSHLNRVSCTSSTFCMAVGGYTECSVDCIYGRTSRSLGLIEAWDGNAWSIVPSPDPGTLGYDIADVSCTSSTFCMAWVTTTLQVNRTLSSRPGTERPGLWPSPNVDDLSSISCSSPTFCMALNDRGPGPGDNRVVGRGYIVPYPRPSPLQWRVLRSVVHQPGLLSSVGSVIMLDFSATRTPRLWPLLGTGTTCLLSRAPTPI